MVSAAGLAGVYQTALESYLVSMARSVESAVNRAIDALLTRNDQVASGVFLTEPRINEMEIIIDDHAVKLLHNGNLPESEVRHVVATVKINNDLERMGDLAVNISQRVISLAQMAEVEAPTELEAMSGSLRGMVNRCLGALVYRNVDMASEVLETEARVDEYRDRIFERLLSEMRAVPAQVPAKVQYMLATRNLERIADHTTNIAEDVVFWLRGLDLRHGRAKSINVRELSTSIDEM